MLTLAQPTLLTIRQMNAGDLDQVCEIEQLSFPNPWPRNAFHYELHANANAHLWVATVERPQQQKRVVGYLILWRILDEAHIATLAIHPHYRQMGIARKLLSTVLQEMTHHYDIRLATLEVRSSNHPAQALYRSFGFREVGRRPRYYRDGEDAILMTLYLDNVTFANAAPSTARRKHSERRETQSKNASAVPLRVLEAYEK
jgi:ribosomal-protein-alanine N-acetyltransferase